MMNGTKKKRLADLILRSRRKSGTHLRRPVEGKSRGTEKKLRNCKARSERRAGSRFFVKGAGPHTWKL